MGCIIVGTELQEVKSRDRETRPGEDLESWWGLVRVEWTFLCLCLPLHQNVDELISRCLKKW